MKLNIYFSDTHVLIQPAITTKNFIFGIPQFLINVVFIVMEQCLNLTLSLKLSPIKMTAKLLKNPSAEFYQVTYNKISFYPNSFYIDSKQATIEKEFEYNNCCQDSSG